MGNWNFLLVAAGELFTPQTAAYALATLGLAVHFGYTGLLNFGQAGFMAVGGYAFAISASAFGLPLWACVLAAVMGSTILALLLGIPTLRLRADYLSIVTIGTAEIVRLVVRSPELEPWTGGSTGINRSGADFFAANPCPMTSPGPWAPSATTRTPSGCAWWHGPWSCWRHCSSGGS
jgi:amino acid/amide ABC transporter membrane protein 2, HAAT family (TC 3.A.1.4.-)